MRKSLFTFLALLLLGALLGGQWAEAHSLWIQSGRHQVSKGKQTPLFFCYGHHIPVDDAVRRKKLAYVRVTAPGGTSSDVALRDEKSLHSYLVDYDRPGTWVLTAETTPGYFTMWTDKKGRTRHTMKPMSTIADQAASVQTSLRSSQWAKTYVACAAPSARFPALVGLPLELAPERDVFAVRVGEKLALQVYADGKPYTGDGTFDATYNGFSPHAEDMYVRRTEFSGGRFEIPVDAAGRWFVRFYTKAPAPKGNEGEYLQEKRTATLVFEVLGQRKRPKPEGH